MVHGAWKNAQWPQKNETLQGRRFLKNKKAPVNRNIHRGFVTDV
jgi:hypothetical protein